MSNELQAIGKVAKEKPNGIVARLNALLGADQTLLIISEFEGEFIYFPRYSTIKRAMKKENE